MAGEKKESDFLTGEELAVLDIFLEKLKVQAPMFLGLPRNQAGDIVVGWQPMDTAPKDGTVVDLWLSGPRNKGAREPDCWFANGKWWRDYLDRGDGQPGFYVDDVVTHWMPKPEPPK